MLEVFLGVLMFTFVILSLVVVLMFARSKLVTSGQVNIVINGCFSLIIPRNLFFGCSKNLYSICMWWQG